MKNKNLYNIQSAGFKTPESYFESVDNAILSKLEISKNLEDVHTNGFNVPDNYFETFDAKVLDSLTKDDSTTVISFFSRKNVVYISGIAASLVLAFTLLFSNSNDLTFENLETASIEGYLIDEDLTAYDIAPYLNAYDMNSDSFVETTINDATIEDYLLQNSDVEHLITD